MNKDQFVENMPGGTEIPAASFWNGLYKEGDTGWDLGEVSPPLKNYVVQLTDKNIRILVPGCGNAYEAEYLLKKGFTNITLIDIAPILVIRLKERFKNNPNIHIIHGDFFAHQGKYDLILEQTFFCAIDPGLRKKYVNKISTLLAPGGKLAGVLFDKEFEQPGPPFGGNKDEYIRLFENDFIFKTIEPCYNSFAKRQGTELFINFVKKQ